MKVMNPVLTAEKGGIQKLQQEEFSYARNDPFQWNDKMLWFYID
jgi:hypothetical protein